MSTVPSPQNPFNITKSVDLTDTEIKRFWVDLSVDGGFTELLKPRSPMPLYLLGGCDPRIAHGNGVNWYM